MNIEFVKQGNAYVAEFKVEADFNLHIERDKNGHITLYQRTSEGGKYALLEEFGYQDGKTVYESDAAGLIYPKFIKVVSAVMPTYAVVTSAGEVTEIKSQTKEIEVTANGTTEVTPDAGFAYLNSVKVKTNVATSGGASSEEKIGMVYLTKEALSQGLDAPMPDTVPQEEFRDMMIQLISIFPIIATRRDGNNCDPIQFIWEDIAENRITFNRWDAVAINFDQLMLNESDYGYIPAWKRFGASIEEAKAVMSQVFPNQLTEDEFFGRA